MTHSVSLKPALAWHNWFEKAKLYNFVDKNKELIMIRPRFMPVINFMKMGHHVAEVLHLSASSDSALSLYCLRVEGGTQRALSQQTLWRRLDMKI